MVPLLGTPNEVLSGCAFSQAANDLKSTASTAGLITSANSKRASSETGTKSFAASKLGIVSTIGSRYIVGPVVTSTMLPSGLPPFTALMPIRPSPPVRFSTKMVRCSAGAISCAISRHSVSPPAPAANGKMILVSPACARVAPTCASSGRLRHRTMNLRRSMGFLHRYGWQHESRTAARGNPAFIL
ncbi:hypothetical protein ACVIQY_003870 [Bradyrhizobium sp. USDA 3051]